MMGLTRRYSSPNERFEVDGANAARNFLCSHSIAEKDIETVWTAIVLHTTPGIPQHMHPVIALVTAGVEMDVLGIAFAEFTEAEREAVIHAHPRRAISRKRLSRPTTMAFTTSRRRPLAISKPTCSPTRPPRSGPRISVA
jgi:hypothetical protein